MEILLVRIGRDKPSRDDGRNGAGLASLRTSKVKKSLAAADDSIKDFVGVKQHYSVTKDEATVNLIHQVPEMAAPKEKNVPLPKLFLAQSMM